MVAEALCVEREDLAMNDRGRRVVIVADTKTHMMPTLARAMARRDHDLVLGDAADGLAGEFISRGASVEVVEGADSREDGRPHRDPRGRLGRGRLRQLGTVR
jgi:hypothetical protein